MTSKPPIWKSLIEKLEAGKFGGKNTTSIIRNGAIDFCIDIVRQHEAEQQVHDTYKTPTELNLSSGHSVVDEAEIQNLEDIIASCVARGDYRRTGEAITVAKDIMQWVSPYLRSPKHGVLVDDGNGGVRVERIPEPVSLGRCAMALQGNGRIKLGSDLQQIAKAVLDAAGVQYVE